MNKLQSKGFSLIELMVVVAVVAVLAAIAYPSYTSYILKSQRTVAITTLLKIQAAYESYYAQNSSYPTSTTNPTADSFLPVATNYYSYANTNAHATTYTLQATALGNQVNDTAKDGTSCGAQPASLTIDQTGNQLPSSCWTQ